MTVTIREAEPKDAAKLIAYVQEIAAEPGLHIVMQAGEFNLTVEQEEQFVANCAAADNSLFLIAESEGEIVGALTCIGGHRRAIRHASELGITVAKEWRGQGIGTAMMERAIEWAKKNGVTIRIELTAFVRNKDAIRLYERLGFKVEGRRQKAIFRDGVYQDNLVMALLLN
jgi:RimJ/RimL family protein N-acetyltransferase